MDTQTEEILEEFTQVTDDGWVNHPSLVDDHPFALFEQTDTDTNTDVTEYDYQYHQLGDVTPFEDDAESVFDDGHSEEEEIYNFGGELNLWNDDGEDMVLDELGQSSSEGDYVYADALGRLHPIPRHFQALQAGQIDDSALLGGELAFAEEYFEEESEDPEEYLEGYLECDFA